MILKILLFIQVFSFVMARKLPPKYKDWFGSYHPHDEIVEWVFDLAIDYPDYVRTTPIGRSHEGRAMHIIQITNWRSTNRSKPLIYLHGGLHAREWAGITTTMYLAQYLAQHAEDDERISLLLDKLEFALLPMGNPDGYEYSFQVDRLWRKNRRSNPDGSFGVELNRNFDDHWGLFSSSVPSSEDYHGPGAASEPEVQAIQNFFFREQRVISGIDFHLDHGNGCTINRPPGYQVEPGIGEEEMVECGEVMVESIAPNPRCPHTGNRYISQRSINLYFTSGTAKDWFNCDQVKNVTGIRPYGYIMEHSWPDYDAPPELIAEIGQETIAPIMNMAEFTLANQIRD